MQTEVCVFVDRYLTRHGLGPVTGYNLEGDAASHLPLCQQIKCYILSYMLTEKHAKKHEQPATLNTQINGKSQQEEV